MAIDRNKLKDAGQRGRTRGEATTVSQALGPAVEPIVLHGREFLPGPLNFGDAKRIERRYPSVELLVHEIEEMRLEAIGFILWLCLRKSDPDLTEEQLDELLPARQDELLLILLQVMQASGLQPIGKQAGEGEPGNAVAPETDSL